MQKLKFGSVIEILIDFLEITIIGTVVALLLYISVGRILEVTGDSMVPTIKDKEQILSERLTMNFKPLQRGNIIIFHHPEIDNRLLIKRIIGLPGETIKLSGGDILINNEPIKEPYLVPLTKTEGGKMIENNVEYKIPGNSYVVLGDNRIESSDSRTFGAIGQSLVVGKALLVYYPLNSLRMIEH